MAASPWAPSAPACLSSPATDDRNHGLPGNRINDLAVDAEGGLWLAMQEGLARLDFEAPFALHGNAQGLATHARRFALWRDQLYLATAEGVSRRDPATGRFVPVAGFQVGANRPLPVGDRLVAATRGLREILADDTSRAWTPELIGPLVAPTRAPGWIYAGSSAGLWLIKPQAPPAAGWETLGRLSTLATGFDELLDRDDGWLWGVTRGGEIARLDFRSGPKLDAPAMLFTPADGVPEAGRNDRIQLLPVGADLVAVASSWLLRFDPAANRFAPETRLTLDGAPVRGARLAGRSATGGAWFRPAEDSSRLLRAEPVGAAWQLTTHALAPFRSVVFDSVFEDTSTRTVWLAGQGVLASLDLDWRPTRPLAPPRVAIRRIETEDGQLLSTGRASPSPLQLGAHQNALRISYAAATFSSDYRGRSQTLYRTRLEGLDRTWSAWSAETHRDFTNLPHRALQFHVQARAPDRPDSTVAAFAFVIATPWWLTAWAFAGYIIAVAGVAWGLFRFRTRQLQRRNAQLEALVASRTQQLERINQELTDAVRIVAHDLRGPVSGIRSLARQLRATPHIWASAEGPEFLGEIERTSGAAVDMMARLLDLQRASDRAAGLAYGAVDVGALVADVCRQLASAAAAKKIALHVTAPATVRITDAESIASIAGNLVSNAIKFLPADGRGVIHVTLAAEANALRLTVADNGPGIPAAERSALFEKFSHGSARPTAGEA
ncbi:MAG: ATP-binding protein, partial [Verrucomicrobiota bacterium]